MSDSTVASTPLEKAPEWYKELRRKWRRLSRKDQRRYFFSRTYRHYVKRWRSGGRDDLLERRQKSVDETREYLDRWTLFLAWMDKHVQPTEERFRQLRGKEVDSTTTSGSTSISNREVYENDVKCYNFFVNKMRNYLEDVDEQFDLATDSADGQSLLDNLIEEVYAAGSDLGLEPHPEWQDGHDGAVWFIDPETNNTFFLALNLFSNFCDVGYAIVARQNPDPRWVNYGLTDMIRMVLDITKPAPMINLARYFKDYFGYFDNNLRLYMTGATEDPPFDWE